MKKRLLILLLAVLCCFSSVHAAEDSPSRFRDVAETNWYSESIQQAVELGLMNGMGDGTFLPEEDLRICEAIKMAAVVHDLYHGGDGSFESSLPWYQVYVDYAIEQCILFPGDFSDYTAYATRGDMAHIFANCLPEEALAPINAVFGIRDVHSSVAVPTTHSADIFRLYRAGVLSGDQRTHAFRPKDAVTRAEAAAIITRLAVPSARERFELLTTSGAGYTLSEYGLLSSEGNALSLGYHTLEELEAFTGGKPVKESVYPHASVDTVTKNDASLPAQEGRIVRANYDGCQLTYMTADQAGVFLYGIQASSETLTDMWGLRVGSTCQEVEAACTGAIYEDLKGQTSYWGDDEGAYHVTATASNGETVFVNYAVNGGVVTRINLSCSAIG